MTENAAQKGLMPLIENQFERTAQGPQSLAIGPQRQAIGPQLSAIAPTPRGGPPRAGGGGLSPTPFTILANPEGRQ